MECYSSVYDWKYGLFFIVSLSFIADVSSLKCYQCFWSEITDNFKIQDKLTKLEDRKYPIAEPFIGMKIQRPPNKTEVMSNCPVVTCKYESDSCLKWSFVSNNPKNITYMCVGNPMKKSGCFQQQIETEDIKEYLKIVACLCNEDRCNGVLSICGHFRIITYAFILLKLYQYMFKII